MASDNHKYAQITLPQVDVVCFGMLSHAYYLISDGVPDHNGGAGILGAKEYIGDDAAIISALLHEWGPITGLICTAVGNDDAGHRIAKQVREAGVQGEIRIWDHISTELELCVGDPSGARTYWQQRNPAVLETLASADLSMIKGARLLYVDWYDGDYIRRAMEEAVHHGVPVYLNIESHYDDEELMKRLVPLSSICQVSMDEPRVASEDDANDVAEQLLSLGVTTAVITRGGGGCLAASGGQVVKARTPDLTVVDGSGAGAVFSTGFIYAYLQGWPLERSARFATAAASFKCSFLGLNGFQPSDFEPLASRVTAG